MDKDFHTIFIDNEIVKKLSILNEYSEEELKDIPDLAILQFKKFYDDLLINGEAIINIENEN